MKAVQVAGDSLEWNDFDEPVLQGNEVLIKVAATAINRADLSNYLKHGHCVMDKGEPAADYAASCTLAYAFDDWALAELSQELGRSSRGRSADGIVAADGAHQRGRERQCVRVCRRC